MIMYYFVRTVYLKFKFNYEISKIAMYIPTIIKNDIKKVK